MDLQAPSTNLWFSNCCSSLNERGTSNKSHFLQTLPFIFHMLSHIDFIHNTNLDFPSKIILTGLTILLVLIGQNNFIIFSLPSNLYEIFIWITLIMKVPKMSWTFLEMPSLNLLFLPDPKLLGYPNQRKSLSCVSVFCTVLYCREVGAQKAPNDGPKAPFPMPYRRAHRVLNF